MYYALFGVYRCKSRLTRLLLKGLVLWFVSNAKRCLLSSFLIQYYIMLYFILSLQRASSFILYLLPFERGMSWKFPLQSPNWTNPNPNPNRDGSWKDSKKTQSYTSSEGLSYQGSSEGHNLNQVIHSIFNVGFGVWSLFMLGRNLGLLTCCFDECKFRFHI